VLFGSIRYLNLLPFQLFLKRARLSNQTKQAMRYRRDVPSAINLAFKRRRVDAAFISSVVSRHCRCTQLGIIADGPVYSVFVVPGEGQEDVESATSNQLARILGLHGEVLIGDKALRYFLDGGRGIDLGAEWQQRTGLPFVFARLCYNRHGKQIERLAKKFGRTRTRVPQGVLRRESARRGMQPQQVAWYLQHIEYRIDHRGRRALRRFWKLSRRSLGI
jgi:chorismate dehydratase